MRVVVSADLHYHPRWIQVLRRLAWQVRNEEPDCLILAGDVGHPLRYFTQGLALFRDLDCPRLALAGNHDLWSGAYSSQELWDHLLEEMAHKAGFVWLDRETLRLGNLGICGTLGWYDYSARAPGLVANDRDYHTNKGMFNNDGNYVDWERSDQEFAAEVLQGFTARLAALCRADEISQILVATHMPPFEENIARKPGHGPGDFAWNFATAYAGNLTLGRTILQCPKVSHVVSGHAHAGGHWHIPAPHGTVESYTVGSDYGRPGYVVLDLPWVAAF